MSGKSREQARDSIDRFSADEVMYGGAEVKLDWLGEIDDSGGQLLQENEALRKQVADLEEKIERGEISLASIRRQDLTIGGFRLTQVGLVIPENTNEDDLALLGHFLFRMEGMLQWLIGDWLLYSEAYEWGETGRIAEKLGKEAQTLYKWKSVAKSVQFFLRRKNLSFTHHELVQGLSQDEQAHWLALAEVNGWSVAAMRKAMGTIRPESVPMPFDLDKRRKEWRQFEGMVSAAAQGDLEARTAAREWIGKMRKVLDDVEEWLR
jgi:hypothetical protein